MTSAQLTFALSIDAPSGHTYAVHVLNASGGAVIATVIPATEDPDAGGSPWETIGPTPIPDAALGKEIRLQWRFTGDGADTYNGAYVDDVMITQP